MSSDLTNLLMINYLMNNNSQASFRPNTNIQADFNNNNVFNPFNPLQQMAFSPYGMPAYNNTAAIWAIGIPAIAAGISSIVGTLAQRGRGADIAGFQPGCQSENAFASNPGIFNDYPDETAFSIS